MNESSKLFIKASVNPWSATTINFIAKEENRQGSLSPGRYVIALEYRKFIRCRPD
jgi:hypothetical protein